MNTPLLRAALRRFLPAALALGNVVSFPSSHAQTLSVTASFAVASEGVGYPGSLVRDGSGRLYGATNSGGAAGAGTVFAVNPDGSGFAVLKHFGTTSTDVSFPNGGLMLGADGRLYGTAAARGTAGRGGVFALNRDGTGYVVLRSFQPSDGTPSGALLYGSDGRLYGVAANNSPEGLGTVFALNTDGSGYAELRRFPVSTEAAIGLGFPTSGLTEASDGRLYGVTSHGGSFGFGTLFGINKNGSGYTILRWFPSAEGGTGRSVVEGSDGKLYGLQATGGASGYGTFYCITKDGFGFTVLSNFSSQEGRPNTQLIEGADGRFYGTADANLYAGSIFAISKSGVKTVLRSLNVAADGNTPACGLVKGMDGRLYGGTNRGGQYDYGTLFAIGEDGSGFSVMHSANVWSAGFMPSGRPLVASDGRVYGTARLTLNGTLDRGQSAGALFSLQSNGSAGQVLHEFQNSPPIGFAEGWNPTCTLIEGLDGRVYGTSQSGGVIDRGTIYRANRDRSGFQVIRHMTVGDGYISAQGIMQATDGRLYGCTSQGSSGAGSVISIAPDGSGFTVLRSLTQATDGANPSVVLVEGDDGRLYGTTTFGGANDRGTIFAIAKDGSNFTVLRHFQVSDGRPVFDLLKASDGRLYGFSTTSQNVGTIYGIGQNGAGFTALRTIDLPAGGLAEGVDGRLYGATMESAAPTIYAMAKDGSGFTAVHSRSRDADGAEELEFGRSPSGDLYGFSRRGGTYDGGTLVKLSFIPVITSPATASGTQGQPFSYQITASFVPTDFDALNLPSGLAVSYPTGLISGTPTVAGNFPVVVAASNGSGSGVAELALSIASAAPVDVTNRVQITRGGFRLNRATGRYVQTVILTNTGGMPIAGPVSLVFDQIPAGITLFAPSGTTTQVIPAGRPYLNVNVGGDFTLTAGESATFSVEFSNPSNLSLTYSNRVLAGPGAR